MLLKKARLIWSFKKNLQVTRQSHQKVKNLQVTENILLKSSFLPSSSHDPDAKSTFL